MINIIPRKSEHPPALCRGISLAFSLAKWMLMDAYKCPFSARFFRGKNGDFPCVFNKKAAFRRLLFWWR
jgi:hypothetical protein